MIMVHKVLIVDDSAYMRSQITQIVSSTPGLQIVGKAANGEQALDMAMEYVPDLVTLDNILPDMTGIDVLRVLKGQLPDTKFLMISAVGQQSTINEANNIGADGYLVKPIDMEAVRSRIEELLNL